MRPEEAVGSHGTEVQMAVSHVIGVFEIELIQVLCMNSKCS